MSNPYDGKGTPYRVTQKLQGERPIIARPEDAEDEPPIPFSLDAQEVARLYVSKTNPDQYRQALLQALREAGGPVSGILRLKLERGQIARVTTPQPGMKLRYVWVSDRRARDVAEYQRQMMLAGR